MSSSTEQSPPPLELCRLDFDSSASPGSQSTLPVLTLEVGYPTETADVPQKFSKGKERSAPQTCEICGERAKSFHYDVASCNGYRNCRACRFDRCILAGMNLEMMKFPASYDVYQAATAIAHRRKELLLGKRSVPFSYHLPYQETAECRELDALVYVESRCHSLRQIIDPCDFAISTLRANISERCRLDKVQMCSADSSSAPAFEFAGRKYDYKAVGMKRIWIAVDFFLFVEAAKTLPVFDKLTLDDKEALLVHVALATTALTRVFFTLAMRSSVVVYPDGTVPMLPFYKTGLEDELLSRIMEPMRRVGLSVEEFVLLKAIIYCSPDAENLSTSGRETLQAERERYAGLLLRHLQRKCGPTVGAKKYAEVIALVDAYFHFGLKHRQHCLLIGVACRMPSPQRLRMVEDIFRGYVNRTDV
ncbi:Nuclear hormone receptor [Aphelenchoides avenae]|nr:Nuclear hormone receptor [Aphelenchus avenae]